MHADLQKLFAKNVRTPSILRQHSIFQSYISCISSVSLLCGLSEEERGRQRRGSERIFSVFLNREKIFEGVRSKKRIFRVPRRKINWNFFILGSTRFTVSLGGSWGRILGRNWDKSLRCFASCYSQPPLLMDFTPPPPPPSKSGLKLVCNEKIFMETSSLRTLKIMPRNLNKIVCLRFRLLNRELFTWSLSPCLLWLVVGVHLMKLYFGWSGFCFTGFLFLFLQWTH